MPGNDRCSDCNEPKPQWASVTYGTLMCLVCSGHHRSIGVHLSFVRSVAMDSWTEKQITAMEKGGNQKLVEYFESRNIPKNMSIPQKYSTKQAEYLRNRLARWLEGKTEPPPDPGRYDPTTGVSEAQGAEAIPGETPEQYNARQARLRDAARERMRQKFGTGGMSGSMGSMGSPMPEEPSGLGGMLGGVGSFLKNNVLDNEKVRCIAGTVGTLAGDTFHSVRRTVADGEVMSSLKSNVTGEEGSFVRSLAGGIAERVGSGGGRGGGCGGGGFSSPSKGLSEDDQAFFASIGQKTASSNSISTGGYNGGSVSNTSARGSGKTSGGSGWNDDDWGDSSLGGKDAGLAKQASAQLNLSPTKADLPTPVPLTRASTAPATTPARSPAKPPMMSTAPEPVKEKAPAKLDEPDDFFAEFGV